MAWHDVAGAKVQFDHFVCVFVGVVHIRYRMRGSRR